MAINLNGTGSITGLSSISSPTISGGSFPAGTAAAPGITLSGDSDTGLYSPGANQIAITTSGTAAVTVDASQRVGIGNNAPSVNLEIGANDSTVKALAVRYSSVPVYLSNSYDGGNGLSTLSTNTYNTSNGSSSWSSFANAAFGSSAVQLSVFNGGGDIRFLTAPGNNVTPSERCRLDSSGRLLVGTSSARGNFSAVDTPQFQVEGTTFNTATISVTSASSSGGGNIELAGTGTGTIGNTGTVSNNGYLGSIHFLGGDGTNLIKGAAIDCQVDGTPGANDMPGRLVFSTTADGASSPTERLRIRNNGVIVANASNFAGVDAGNSANTGFAIDPSAETVIIRDGGTVLTLGRQSSDGTIVEFRQAGTTEGTISVSGTTVSYNGAHLSRWSQLSSGVERTEILRGSVLSNIDEMCEWGDEDNEQLNRMKVSDVEGDKNVSGVFQAWDDDDDTYTNDFYCAMTGDFIIRIGAGVTVERGDLLMSAGDGTAKPQDDDIIRSKTIAKVTSTNVSCTYDDGSYCVPCVLMAC